jgi:hypothetical protein
MSESHHNEALNESSEEVVDLLQIVIGGNMNQLSAEDARES